MTNLSVLVLTHDEEKNLPDLLASLDGLECNLFVMDSGSTDSTVDIARGAGATIFTHLFDNYGAQRNRAQDLLPDQSGWVLHLDADERLTSELVDEIRGLMSLPSPAVDGYMLRQRTVFMGRWIKHGGHYPAYHLRLFRTAKGRCEDRLYDQHFMVKGSVKRARNDYIDTVGADLATWTARHARWAALQADEMRRRPEAERLVRARLRGTPIERRRWLRVHVLDRSGLIGRSFGYWFYRYVLRGGFLDGKEGLIFHFLQGCWFQFLVGAMSYEQEVGFGRMPPPESKRR